MKKKNLIFGIPGIFLAALPLVLLVFLIVGCESESATQTDIKISPSYAEVSRGRASVLLSASGWSDYRWSLTVPSIGYLSSSVGDSVVYTATAFPSSPSSSGSNALEQVVSVTADVPGTSGTPSSETNTTTIVSGIYTGTTRIVHK